MIGIGEQFGRWTVIECINQFDCKCRCICGTERHVIPINLTSGRSRSCGCYRSEVSRETDHGFVVKKHQLYTTWQAMKYRCYNKSSVAYKDYGGRGIYVCDRWHHFINFVSDMFPTWKKGLSIDRIDVNGPYSPDNCRWATDTEQTTNRRIAKLIDTPWGRMTIGAAAKRLGMSYVPMMYRIQKWPQERWFDPPSRK